MRAICPNVIIQTEGSNAHHERENEMTRYFANSAATRKNRPLATGFDTEAGARDQAEFLAMTYGGVARVSTNTGEAVAQFSAKKGWH